MKDRFNSIFVCIWKYYNKSESICEGIVLFSLLIALTETESFDVPNVFDSATNVQENRGQKEKGKEQELSMDSALDYSKNNM